jgi:hypothetical protein
MSGRTQFALFSVMAFADFKRPMLQSHDWLVALFTHVLPDGRSSLANPMGLTDKKSSSARSKPDDEWYYAHNPVNQEATSRPIGSS